MKWIALVPLVALLMFVPAAAASNIVDFEITPDAPTRPDQAYEVRIQLNDTSNVSHVNLINCILEPEDIAICYLPWQMAQDGNNFTYTIGPYYDLETQTELLLNVETIGVNITVYYTDNDTHYDYGPNNDAANHYFEIEYPEFNLEECCPDLIVEEDEVKSDTPGFGIVAVFAALVLSVVLVAAFRRK